MCCKYPHGKALFTAGGGVYCKYPQDALFTAGEGCIANTLRVKHFTAEGGYC